MIELYHNPKCSKSRATLEILEKYLGDNNLPASQLKVRTYLEDPLSVAELSEVQEALGRPLLDLVRTKEARFGELGLTAESDAATLLAAVADNPMLMERPVVRYQQRAAIGRPPEDVLTILP